jgi:hypothetical protein
VECDTAFFGEFMTHDGSEDEVNKLILENEGRILI